ncbi:MAG: translation initiation factor IF-2 subunit beta [Thermoprotei archaeon]|nr:MAG: translation initiation factor IF-2 subunit beta [Thermoprotei archaeon]
MPANGGEGGINCSRSPGGGGPIYCSPTYRGVALTDYEWLLERAYKALPPRRVRRERFKLEPPEVLVTGKRTFIVNFKQICDTVNREPRVLLRYLLRELGASGDAEDQFAVIYGVFSPKLVRNLIERFVKNYVFCPVCGSPDTVLKKEKKIMYLKCMACGAVSPVRPF